MINLTKEESIKQIDLRKQVLIDLTKDTPLEAAVSRVALVLDFSGSMQNLYRSGKMQEAIERILPLSLKFDDNGELEFWIFWDGRHGFERLPEVTLDNFYGLTDNLLKEYRFGGTDYAPVLRDVYKKYIKESPMNIPTYVLFITDGECYDEAETTAELIKGSHHPVFLQFIGIGDEDFEFLSHLDEMEGRYVDNANFFHINQLSSMSDSELYSKLLQEYPQWLEYPEVKAMLKGEHKAPVTPMDELNEVLNGGLADLQSGNVNEKSVKGFFSGISDAVSNLINSFISK